MKERVFRFKVDGKKVSVRAGNEIDAWKEFAKEYGYNNVDDFYEDINYSFGEQPELLNSGDPLDYRNQIGMSASKSDCEQMGGAWVKGYTKHINGRIVRVDGYCREQQSIYHY